MDFYPDQQPLDKMHLSTLQKVFENDREALEKRRLLLKTVAHDAKGPMRRKNISQLSKGTGGGPVPTFDSDSLPQSATYNTARGSFFN